jgi:hypothetical protein
MLLKKRIESLIKEFLHEPEKHKIHRLEIRLPGHDGRFWIIDAFSLMPKPEAREFQLAIYFSINQHSKKGRQIAQTIEILDLFKDYIQCPDGRQTAFYKVTDNNGPLIAEEILNKTDALFPTLDNSDIQVHLVRRENWAELLNVSVM